MLDMVLVHMHTRTHTQTHTHKRAHTHKQSSEAVLVWMELVRYMNIYMHMYRI